MIDHVTYMVSKEDLEHGMFRTFFALLDMHEVHPDPAIEKSWQVRWFKPNAQPFPLIHLVAGPRTPELELAHFCVTFDTYNHATAVQLVNECRDSAWLERDSGSGRIWLKGPGGIRVEVRAH